MKLGIFNGVFAIVLALVTHLLLGCAGQVSEPPQATDAPVTAGPYHVDRCGDTTGASGELIAYCNGSDIVLGASCEVTPAVDGESWNAWTAVRPNPSQWGCQTSWGDPERGGKICVHLTCVPAVRPLDGTNGCDTYKEEVPQ